MRAFAARKALAGMAATPARTSTETGRRFWICVTTWRVTSRVLGALTGDPAFGRALDALWESVVFASST